MVLTAGRRPQSLMNVAERSIYELTAAQEDHYGGDWLSA